MLSNSTIALIIIISLLVFVMFYNTKSNIGEHFDPNKTIDKKELLKQNIIKKQVIEDVASYFSDDMISNYSLHSNDSLNIEKKQVNPNFINVQFHNDYRDVYTALMNIVPDKRQLFNVANIPLRYSEPGLDEVKLLLKDFIAVLNENLKSEVPLYRNPNSGWDEAIIDQPNESGWDRVQKALGLPVSLYSRPAGKGIVEIVKVNKISKYETEDELMYQIEVILAKRGVDDQMVIKGSFVIDKRILMNEDNFFVSGKVDLKVQIQEIFTVGFLSKGGLKNTLSMQDLDVGKEVYGDANYETNVSMTDPKYVMKTLNERYNTKEKESTLRNSLLDEEARDFHRYLPNSYNFSNIQSVKTIFNDEAGKQIWY